MKNKLLCPNCGHHIADFTTPSPAPGPGHYTNVLTEPFEAFLRDRCVLDKSSRVETKELRARYLEWCAENDETPLTPQAMGRVLAATPDVKSTASNGKRYYTGITFA